MDRRKFLGVASGLALGATAFAAETESVRIGVIRTLFQDTDENTARASVKHFKKLMRRETQIAGDSLTISDIWKLTDDVAAGKLQLGVAFGYEFAWGREKHADLKPLVIAVNQDRYVRAHVLVQAQSPVKDFAGLAGKSLAVAIHTKPYCRLFVERECDSRGKPWDKFFGPVSRPANLEDALDDVVDGTTDAALVDAVGLSRYAARKPIRFAKLRSAAVSEPFPASVVFYRPGGIDDSTRDRFRDALLHLTDSADGRQIMLEWKLTNFDTVPEDYNQALEKIAKVFPAPKST